MVILMCCLPVNAVDEEPFIQRVTMTIYGDASYVNYIPLPAGTVIVAKDQFKSILGTYTLREPGRIGKEYTKERFEIGVWRNQSDVRNRSMPIFITFFVGGIPTKSTLDFQQNEDLKYDIIARSLPTDPTIVETIVPTSTANPQPTSVPSGVRTLPTSPIIVPTVVAITTSTTTIQPIAVSTTQLPQVTSIPVTQPPVDSPEDNRQWVYYGIIATIVVVAGILVIGVIASYVYNKSSRDDVMQQDGTWNKK